MHRFLARLWRLGTDVAEQTGQQPLLGPLEPPAGRRPGADAQGALGDRQGHERHGRPLRVQHRDRGRDGAGQRGLPPPRRTSSPATLHFATATAASLIFPFAPHTGAEVYEALTGERVWETPWPDGRPVACSSATSSRSSCRSTASCATASRRPRAPRARSSRRWRASARTCIAHIDGKQVMKVIVVPSKLVNFVVR